MSEITIEQAKKIPNFFLLKILNKMKKELINNEIIKDLYNKYDLDINELYYIPMMFKDLDVSAKCDHGMIFFNYKLLCDGDFSKHYGYAIHEITHFLQQTGLDKPTQGADDGEYLENPFEQEAFQHQIEFMADEFGKNKAEKYVDNLLNHHEISDDEWDNKKDELMSRV